MPSTCITGTACSQPGPNASMISGCATADIPTPAGNVSSAIVETSRNHVSPAAILFAPRCRKPGKRRPRQRRDQFRHRQPGNLVAQRIEPDRRRTHRPPHHQRIDPVPQRPRPRNDRVPHGIARDLPPRRQPEPRPIRMHRVAEHHPERLVGHDPGNQRPIRVQHHRRYDRHDDAQHPRQQIELKLPPEFEVSPELDSPDIDQVLNQHRRPERHQHRRQPRIAEETRRRHRHRRHDQKHHRPAQHRQRERRVHQLRRRRLVPDDALLDPDPGERLDRHRETRRERDQPEIRRRQQPHQHQRAHQAQRPRQHPPCDDPPRPARGLLQDRIAVLAHRFGLTGQPYPKLLTLRLMSPRQPQSAKIGNNPKYSASETGTRLRCKELTHTTLAGL